MSAQGKHLAEVNVVNISNLARVESSLRTITIYLAKIKASGVTSSQIEEFNLYLQDATSDFDKYLQMYASIATSDKEKQMISALKEAFEPQREELQYINKVATEDLANSVERLSTNAQVANGSKIEAALAATSKLIVTENESGFKNSQEISRSSKSALLASVGMIAIFIVLSVIYAILLSKSIANRLVETSKRAAESSITLARMSENMDQSSRDLKEGVVSQASVIQSSTAAMTEITAMVEKIADEAKRSLEQALDGEKMTDAGRNDVADLGETLREIFAAVENLLAVMNQNTERVSQIKSTFDEIVTKTKVIDEIVFQTKLLSFNASVEAARAGEYGKGFAVVAEEVGNLARMSGGAAAEINRLLENSANSVQSIVDESRKESERSSVVVKEKIQDGHRKKQSTANVLDKIFEMSQVITARAKEISTAIEEQKKGIEEIGSTFNRLENITEKASTTAKENQALAQQVGQEASRAKASVEALEVLILGESTVKNVGKASEHVDYKNNSEPTLEDGPDLETHKRVA